MVPPLRVFIHAVGPPLRAGVGVGVRPPERSGGVIALISAALTCEVEDKQGPLGPRTLVPPCGLRHRRRPGAGEGSMTAAVGGGTMGPGTERAEGPENTPPMPVKPRGLSDDTGPVQLPPRGRPPTPWQGAPGATPRGQPLRPAGSRGVARVLPSKGSRAGAQALTGRVRTASCRPPWGPH